MSHHRAASFHRNRWSVFGPFVLAVQIIISVVMAGRGLQAANLKSGFTETQVASGLNSPTAMTFAPDGRVFICQQGGQLRVVKDGTLLGSPFVSLNVNSSGERGLLGVAFDPDFVTNQFIYLYYTATSPVCEDTVKAINARRAAKQGTAKAEYLKLDDMGILGVTHMMMLDKKNLEIADIMMNWVNKNVSKKR